MENGNDNMQQNSTYHYGRNESPFGREDVSGRADSGDTRSQNTGYTSYQSSASQSTVNQAETQSGAAQTTGNTYSQGNPYGQGVYNGNDFVTQEPKKKKKNKKEKKPSSGKVKKVGLFIASAAVFGLIAGSVMVGVNAVGNKVLGKHTKNPEIATVTPTNSGVQTASKETGSVADVAEEVMPSIVSITNTSVQTVRSWFQSYEREVIGSGSGIIIGQTDSEIMIVTNNHVIEGAKELTVAFCDETAVEATVKGADSSMDLAVVTVKTADMDTDTLAKIKVAALGSSDELRVGEPAIAIGNALGYGQAVTGGYISAINREVDLEDKVMTLLQTDAAINPGNSGGALLNENGEVIGINTVKFVDSEVEGMGYAIPISIAIPIINDLMNQEIIEESEQGYLGIQGKDITDEYSDFNMPKGVYVVKILENSPADKCGLKAGDIITKLAGRNISSMDNLTNVLAGKKAGQEVEMTVQRNDEKGEYKEVTLTVTLGAKKDMPSDDDKQDKGDDRQKNNDGENNDQENDEWEDNGEDGRYYMTPDELPGNLPDDFFDFFGN